MHVAHSWRGLAGLSPSALSEGSLLGRKGAKRGEGGGWEGREEEGGRGWTASAKNPWAPFTTLGTWVEGRLLKGEGRGESMRGEEGIRSPCPSK